MLSKRLVSILESDQMFESIWRSSALLAGKSCESASFIVCQGGMLRGSFQTVVAVCLKAWVIRARVLALGTKWFDEIVMCIMNEEVLNFSTACKHIARLTQLDSRLSICVESTVACGGRHLSYAMIKDASNHGKLHSRRQSKRDRSKKRKHQTKIEV